MATGENVLALQQCQLVASSVVLNATTNTEEQMIVFESVNLNTIVKTKKISQVIGGYTLDLSYINRIHFLTVYVLR